MRLQRPIKNIRYYIKLIDQKDNLWKIERELKKIVSAKPQNIAQRTTVKKPTDLLPVNICYIGTIGFYWNLIQPNTVAFTTSLYKIDRLIEEKEALAQDQLNGKEYKLIDKELVDQTLPYWCRNLKDIFSKAVSNTLTPY